MRTSQHAESGHGHNTSTVVPTVDPLPGDEDARFSSEPYGVSGRAGDGISRGESRTFGESGRQNGPGGGNDADTDADADAPLAADEEGGAVDRKRDAPHVSALPPPNNLSQKPRALTLSSKVKNHGLVTSAAVVTHTHAVTFLGAAQVPSIAIPTIPSLPPVLSARQRTTYHSVADATRSRLINDITMNKALSIIGAVVGWFCLIFIGRNLRDCRLASRHRDRSSHTRAALSCPVLLQWSWRWWRTSSSSPAPCRPFARPSPPK